MGDLRGRQVEFNASSRDQWDVFAGHRARVSALLGAGSGGGPKLTRLCVLGAGNGNDLDLAALADAHREVHLVDLDAEALERGVARQGVADHPTIRRIGGVEVTGMLDAIGAWTSRTTIPPAEVEALADWPMRRVAPTLPGPFDLVASTCLLTQLIGNITLAVGDRHPQFASLVRALRVGHLRLLADLTAPGGTAVLITDVASSNTSPALRSTPETALPGLLRRLANEGGCIHGVNPAALSSTFRDDPVLSAKVSDLEAVPPWFWNLHDRLYLVWALRWRRPRAALG